MALKIALVAQNPSALERAKRELLAEHPDAWVWGHSSCCEIALDPETSVTLLDEVSWRAGRFAPETVDQIFVVNGAALGIDFSLMLQERLRRSQVPEEWQWQKWSRGGNE